MDATKIPLLIPPEFSSYAEKYEIFETVEVWHAISCFKVWFYDKAVQSWPDRYVYIFGQIWI
jgi:hypothetical protein